MTPIQNCSHTATLTSRQGSRKSVLQAVSRLGNQRISQSKNPLLVPSLGGAQSNMDIFLLRHSIFLIHISHTINFHIVFSAAFAKLLKQGYQVCHVHLSIRMEQLSSHWMDLHEI